VEFASKKTNNTAKLKLENNGEYHNNKGIGPDEQGEGKIFQNVSWLS